MIKGFRVNNSTVFTDWKVTAGERIIAGKEMTLPTASQQILS